MITISVDKYSATPEVFTVGTEGSYGIETLKINLSDDYADMTVYVAFDVGVSVLVPASGIIDFPAEATADANMHKLKIVGFKDGHKINSIPVQYYVAETIPDQQGEPDEPTRTLAEQLIDAAEDAIEQAGQSSEAAAESAEAAAESAQQAAGAVAGTVKYNIEQQTLTDQEKLTARTNIGAASASKLTEVELIAKGAQKAYVAPSYQALIESLNSATADMYAVGQNILIRTLEVPDLWIYSIEDESVPYNYTTDEALIAAMSTAEVQVGYYTISMLEARKVIAPVQGALLGGANGFEAEIDGDGKIILPLATDTVCGVVEVSLNGNSTGVTIQNGLIKLIHAPNAYITNRTNYPVPITPKTLPFAYKSAACAPESSTDPAWTDEEQAAARARLGIEIYNGGISDG